MKRALLVVALLPLIAGASCQRRVVIQYVPVEVVREVYVPVEADLTNPHVIAEGPLSACPDVAAQRRRELEACNADKAAIRGIQGQPVKEN